MKKALFEGVFLRGETLVEVFDGFASTVAEKELGETSGDENATVYFCAIE